jgi:putative ABC transport system permease protein
MTALQRQLWREPTSVADGYDVWMEPLTKILTGGARAPLMIMGGAAAALLLVACANVTTLMLVRSASRRRETATRLVLGAAPVRVVRLLALESAVLSMAGGAAGLGIAWASLQALATIGTALPRFHEAGLTLEVMGFALIVSIGTALVCTLPPLAEMRREQLTRVLNDSSRGGSQGPRTSRLRRALVAVQIGSACALLITGSLLLRSFVNVLRVDPGFDAAAAVFLDLYLPGSRYPDAAAHTRFYRELVRSLEAVPGVEAAGGLLYFPFKPKLWPVSVQVQGRVLPQGQEPVAFYNQIAGDYFAAMGRTLEAGRLRTEREIWEAGNRLVVITGQWLGACLATPILSAGVWAATALGARSSAS